MQDTENGHRGGCKCGAIRFRTVPHAGNAYVCNCHFCQKATGGPFLVEHCFTKDEIEILSGTPTLYTHVSAGSGKEIYLHFCVECGSHLFLALQRWENTMNVFTTTFDVPQEVGFDADILRYLFLGAAQSGTITPKGFHAFEGHCDPADGSPAVEHVFDRHVATGETEAGDGPHTGGCLCGSIRFEADGQPEAVVICHCRSCQKSLGSGVNFELLWTPSRFRVVRGTPKTFQHSGGSGKLIGKRFCGECGSALWLTGERFPEIGVFRGSLDRPNRIEVSPRSALQIFLSEALPCGMVIAGIESFAEHRRAPDGSINKGRIYDDHWRIGDAERS
ncbi:GFA family protein [Pseudooceanicola nanhaiensis]|uniref:GFA family protein n=1 Tax=Pseudooceanicola nanhaiensis TaxID=375761 RepID=UPI0035140CD9